MKKNLPLLFSELDVQAVWLPNCLFIQELLKKSALDDGLWLVKKIDDPTKNALYEATCQVDELVKKGNKDPDVDVSGCLLPLWLYGDVHLAGRQRLILYDMHCSFFRSRRIPPW